MDKRFMAILAVIVIAFAGILFFSKHSGNGGSGNAQPTSHIEGKGAAGVTLTEYGDYECPVCGQYYLPLKQAVAKLSSQIYFQFRNLPLTSIHANAYSGARAAEAAGLQDKYWQMHDLLYENQDPSGRSGWVADRSNVLDNYFVKYAKTIGLDTNKFKTDYASAQVNDAISADMNEFSKTGQAQATPSFFINGKYVDNSQFSTQTATGFVPSADKIVQVLQAAIAAKR